MLAAVYAAVLAVIHIRIPVDVVALSAAIGTVFPLIAAFLKQDGWSAKTNMYLCVVLAVVAAVVTAAAQATLNPHNVVASFVVIYGLAETFYKGLWKPSGIEPKLKAASSFVKATDPPVPPTSTTADPVNTTAGFGTVTLTGGPEPAITPPPPVAPAKAATVHPAKAAKKPAKKTAKKAR